jgi:MtN3 and saliva related transmembrane protein
MEVGFQISGFIFAAGWLISGVLFALQAIKIYRKKDAEGISIVTFAGFALLNTNAALYGYLSGNPLWLPGTLLAAVSCTCIALMSYRIGQSHKNQV